MGRSNNAHSNIFSGGVSVPRQISVHARGAVDNSHVTIKLNFVGTIGQGTFGQIERATLTTGEQPKDGDCHNLNVAVKRVLQDPRYKNRELSIMQRLNNHPNVVKFFYYYYSTSSNTRPNRSGSNRTGASAPGVDVFLHLVLECFPENLCELIFRYSQRSVKIPVHLVKVFTFQMLKALAYLHENQICHRDIKSSNLLVNESTLVLKVCDFGSAKEMVTGGVNVSYISSRYYRAPELLFGAQVYSFSIDIWSGGCVLAEMLRKHCLFTGANSLDQLVKIIRVMGTPSQQDIASMNSMYCSYNFPDVQSCPVKLFFPQHTPTDLLALMCRMLVYNPSHRVEAAAALGDACFDELRQLGPEGLLPDHVPMPPHLFDPHPPMSACPPLPVNNDDEVPFNCSGASKKTMSDAANLSNDDSGRRRGHNSKQQQQQSQAVPLPQNASGAPGADGINSIDCQRKGRGGYPKQSPPTGNCSHPSGGGGVVIGAPASGGSRPTPSSRKLVAASGTSSSSCSTSTSTSNASSTGMAAAAAVAGKNGVPSSSSCCCSSSGKRPSEPDHLHHHGTGIDGDSAAVNSSHCCAGNSVLPTAPSGRQNHDSNNSSGGSSSSGTGTATGEVGSGRTPGKQSLSEAAVT